MHKLKKHLGRHRTSLSARLNPVFSISMNHPALLQRLARTAQVLFVSCLITGLFACAPGTGGTGTGPVQTVLSSQSITAGNNIVLTSFGSLSTTTTMTTTTTTTGGSPVPPSNSSNQLPACPALSAGQTRVTTTLSLTTSGIQYQQDCYLFTYQGSWEFDAALSLNVKGSVTDVFSPTRPAQDARLQLRASEPLATSAVPIRAVLLDSNGVQTLSEQFLLPSTP